MFNGYFRVSESRIIYRNELFPIAAPIRDLNENPPAIIQMIQRDSFKFQELNLPS